MSRSVSYRGGAGSISVRWAPGSAGLPGSAEFRCFAAGYPGPEAEPPPGDYKVLPGEERGRVTCLKTGETVYRGIGPVEVLRSG